MYPFFDKRRLFERKKKWLIHSIHRWWYMFSDTKPSQENLLSIANKINKPSYISCESALYYYNLIPEWVFLTTSVTTKKTATYTTDIWTFRYQKIANTLFFWFQIISRAENTYKIAYKEKAILDFLYLKPHIKTQKDMIDLRIDRDEFFEGFNQKRWNNYLRQFNQKELTKRAELLFTLLKNDV